MVEGGLVRRRERIGGGAGRREDKSGENVFEILCICSKRYHNENHCHI